ncbi:hypothetical protein GIB67_010326 [Kingdonia uniflora]|uniref:Uncharacterized protein n=1 Tax=Kingdonia uniflora TaxID=39325 RepID=A0A7J7MA95_9MAGN|nr:hypothetical protein GIB67_010326 [Kingdonia uniflora]
MVFEVESGDTLIKVGLFLLVQALVYFILTSSSNVFSTNMRSFSFKRTSSTSMRRLLAAISDLPPGGEPSPLSRRDLQSPRGETSMANDYKL